MCVGGGGQRGKTLCAAHKSDPKSLVRCSPSAPSRSRRWGWRVDGGGGAGHCFDFHFGIGGVSSLGPLPPSPLALNHVRIRVRGTFFVWASFLLPRLRRT